jgi:hypothetical protein
VWRDLAKGFRRRYKAHVFPHQRQVKRGRLELFGIIFLEVLILSPIIAMLIGIVTPVYRKYQERKQAPVTGQHLPGEARKSAK